MKRSQELESGGERESEINELTPLNIKSSSNVRSPRPWDAERTPSDEGLKMYEGRLKMMKVIIIGLIILNLLLMILCVYSIYMNQITLSNYQQSIQALKGELQSSQHNMTIQGIKELEEFIIKYGKEGITKIPDNIPSKTIHQTLRMSMKNLTLQTQQVASTTGNVDSFFLPPTGSELPRYAGIATFMRLPLVRIHDNEKMLSKVQIGIKGVPWDGGTTNRAGARHGPRAVRDASTLIRDVNRATGIDPFQLQNCADLGDVYVNPVDLSQTLDHIQSDFSSLVSMNISPLAVGGDHLSTLPVLRALAERYPGGMALIHFDAHCDTWDTYFSPTNRYTHGTTFRRAIEEGLISENHTVQIGLRGALYRDARDTWSHDHGILEIDLDQFHRLGSQQTIQTIHSVVKDRPVYITFDIDVLDPAYAPGTGTPEVGGMTVLEAQQLIRGLSGLNIIGGDVMEISPPFDTNGQITSMAGATILYEILCVLAESRSIRST